MKPVVPLVSGLLFALGLGLSGMTRPEKVIGFLDFAGAWDPSLAFVMLGAVGVHFAVLRWSRAMAAPFAAAAFERPAGERVDARLVAGAALFGVGWGLSGYCPGPALVSLAGGALPTLVVVAGMVGGVLLAELPPAPGDERRILRPGAWLPLAGRRQK